MLHFKILSKLFTKLSWYIDDVVVSYKSFYHITYTMNLDKFLNSIINITHKN